MSQMTVQNKTPEKELNKMETGNLPNAQFKTLMIRMVNEQGGGVDELHENFKKEIGDIKMELENVKKQK